MENRPRAVIFMLISAASFAAMGGFVKAATEVPLLEKVLVRNLVTLTVAALIALRNRVPLLGSRQSQPLLIARSLLGLGGVTCYFYAIDNLILADAAMLTKLSPFFVAIFAFLFLGERLSRPVLLALVAAFTGGLCLVKPQLDLRMVPALVGMGSAVFAGGAYTTVRSLRRREQPETIIFHFSLVTVLALLPPTLSSLRLPQGWETLWLLGIGLCAAAGQFGLTIAYRHAPAAQVSIYTYTTILFSALIGFLLWSEVPDLLSLLGGLLIISGGLISFAADRKGILNGRPGSSTGST